jgi:hypothetical protein
LLDRGVSDVVDGDGLRKGSGYDLQPRKQFGRARAEASSLLLSGVDVHHGRRSPMPPMRPDRRWLKRAAL